MVKHHPRVEDLIGLVRDSRIQAGGPHLTLLAGPNLLDDFAGSGGNGG
jgi:hypothetical protein